MSLLLSRAPKVFDQSHENSQSRIPVAGLGTRVLPATKAMPRKC